VRYRIIREVHSDGIFHAPEVLEKGEWVRPFRRAVWPLKSGAKRAVMSYIENHGKVEEEGEYSA
jgi:hypothetical protein